MFATCAVCINVFGDSDVDQMSITTCGHVFHVSCVSKWLEYSKTCPECPNAMTESSIIRVSLNVSTTGDVSESEGSAEQQKMIDVLRNQLSAKEDATKEISDSINQLKAIANSFKGQLSETIDLKEHQALKEMWNYKEESTREIEQMKSFVTESEARLRELGRPTLFDTIVYILPLLLFLFIAIFRMIL